MGNLLRLVLALTEDEAARRRFRTDPDEDLDGLDDLTGEDVAAVVDLVRVQVDPALAERLTVVLSTRPAGEPDPRTVAVRSLLAVCDALDEVPTNVAPPGGEPIPEHPPHGGRAAHLWAIDGRAEGAEDEAAAPTRLQPVPDPPGGFVFAPLELVRLPAGLPERGIEPGALATVVAVHHEPELRYEIEVNDDDGARLFLGTVPPSAVDRY